MTAAEEREPFPRGLPWLLLVGGGIGLLAAFVLTVERFALAEDSGYIPTCSINPVLSCGSVMTTAQAAVFGFPNPLLGIAGFAVVATAGAALLAGGRLAGWYWAGLQLGATAGAVFVHWLIGQSLYRIGALCPYCMIVWAVTVPIFWYVTLRNLDRRWPTHPAVAVLVRLHSAPLALWFAVLVALVLLRFGPEL